jgi:hypothetical protein
VFGDRASGACRVRFAWTNIVRHRMVMGGSSPDDPSLAQYLGRSASLERTPLGGRAQQCARPTRRRTGSTNGNHDQRHLGLQHRATRATTKTGTGRIGKRLTNLPALREIGFHANRRPIPTPAV